MPHSKTSDRFDEMAQMFCMEHVIAVDDQLSALLRKVHDEAVAAERERLFPVMGGPSVPWRMVAPYEAQALTNHGQSLETLAGRGGLSPVEIWLVVRGLYTSAFRTVSPEDARHWVTAWVEQDRLTQTGLFAARKVVEVARHAYDCLARHCAVGTPIECCGAMAMMFGDALAEYDKAVRG